MSPKLCPFCMRMPESDVCPHCGKNIHYEGSPAHLPAGYVVSGKHPYVIGAALGQGGFGETYSSNKNLSKSCSTYPIRKPGAEDFRAWSFH